MPVANDAHVSEGALRAVSLALSSSRLCTVFKSLGRLSFVLLWLTPKLRKADLSAHKNLLVIGLQSTYVY